MRRLSKYVEVGRITLRSQLTYLADTAMGTLFLALAIFVFVYLWRATYAGQERLAGYTLPQMIWYLVLTETLVVSAPRVHMKMDADVKSGDLAHWLNKPFSYLGFQFSGYVVELAVRTVICLAVGGAVAGFMVGGFDLDPRSLLPVAVAFLCSQTVQFLIAAAIGLSAFWLEDVNGVYLVVDRTKWILGGLLLPVEVFPDALRRLAAALPFQYLLSGPARLLVHFSWDAFFALLARQLLWLAVALAVCGLLWRRGVRRLDINGG